MKAVVAAFNQEKALVGAFSVIMNLRMELFQALVLLHVGGVIAMVTVSGSQAGEAATVISITRHSPECHPHQPLSP